MTVKNKTPQELLLKDFYLFKIVAKLKQNIKFCKPFIEIIQLMIQTRGNNVHFERRPHPDPHQAKRPQCIGVYEPLQRQILQEPLQFIL